MQRGGDLYRLKEVMGHKRIETTMRYAALRQESLREEMQKLFGDDQEAPSELATLRTQVEALQAENERLRDEDE